MSNAAMPMFVIRLVIREINGFVIHSLAERSHVPESPGIWLMFPDINDTIVAATAIKAMSREPKREWSNATMLRSFICC